jgi:hypothetical protein
MARSPAIAHPSKSPSRAEEWPEWVQEDARWCIAQRIVASRHFARSSLLSRFLLYIVAETIEGRSGEITEHQIGVRVFERPAGYRTVEDNIVRNYARQLRRRLADYSANEGASDPLHIDIPVGGYVPVFASPAGVQPKEPRLEPAPAEAGYEAAQMPAPSPVHGGSIPEGKRWGRFAGFALLLAVYSGVLIGVTWYAAIRFERRPPAPDATTPLWTALFGGPANSYIIPADAGFNLLKDVSLDPIPLADYIQGSYLRLPLPRLDPHSAEDLRTQQFSSFVDLEIVAALERLPEFNPQRTILRFPRELHLDDLKHSNAVILGSKDSNPWAAVAESGANFRIVDRAGGTGASIINVSPRSGEAASYVSHWNEPAHETYAVIAFLPGLSGSGHLLLLQGLDVAGTQAAAETLLHPAAIAQILAQATRADGSLRHFEILLRTTSIESNSMGAQVVSSRIY